MRNLLVLAAVCFASWSVIAGAAQPSPVNPAVPLAGLPSQPGPHVARIAAMADDAWLDLDKPAPDPKYGTPGGRSWGAKMAYAPDLHVAFLFGEGQHGWWNKQTGRYMDDLWAYDIRANRWICVYAGADVNTLDLKLNEHGIETTQTGEPMPVAQMVHCYEGTTYDADLHRFMFMPCSGGYWEAAMGERRMKWLGTKKNEVASNCSPWMYDTRTDRWDRKPTAAPSAAGGFGDVLVYVPTVKKVFLRHHPDVWWYDPAKNEWTLANPKGPQPPFGIDPTACYDTKRDRIYMGGGSYPVAKEGTNALWVYDVQSDAWIDPSPNGTPCGGSNRYNSNVATMTYDQANDVVVLNRHKTEDDKNSAGIWIYDPKTNAWDTKPRLFPEPGGWRNCVNAFYDPELNVHVYHIAHDSEPNGSIRMYRWKGAVGGK